MKFTPTSLGKTLQRSFSSGLLPIFLAATLATFPVHVPKASAFSGSGAGTEGDPYLITSCTELEELDEDLTAAYRLTTDLTCTTELLPLAREMSGSSLTGGFSGFTGIFDGDGYSIDYDLNFSVGENTENYLGLFGFVGTGGVVKDVYLTGGVSTADTLSGGSYVGTLAGYVLNATIQNVHVYSNVTSTTVGDAHVGALAGRVLGSRVVGFGVMNALGGEVTVSAPNANYVGGAFGSLHDSSVARAYVWASPTGSDLVGGIAGHASESDLTDLYANGTVTGDQTATGISVGGLLGSSYGNTLTRTHAQVDLLGYDDVGGLIGTVMTEFEYRTTITDSFAVADFVAYDQAGGVIGDLSENDATFLTLDNVYWDQAVSSLSICDAESRVSSGCTGVDTSSDTSYWITPANEPLVQWDFDRVWFVNADPFPYIAEFFSQEEFYVTTDGTSEAECTEFDPCDLQTALTRIDEEASSDTTVYLAAGTYDAASGYSYLADHRYALTLDGADADTTILAPTTGNGLTIYSNGDLTISDLQFSASAGTGLIISGGEGDPFWDSFTMSVQNSIFSGNGASGLVVTSTDPAAWTIAGNVFENNTTLEGLSGGGLRFAPGSSSTLLLSANTFQNNFADLGDGGGAYVSMSQSDSAVSVPGNTFTDNDSDGLGGGIYVQTLSDDSPISFTGNTLTGNTAVNGGGFVLDTDGSPTTDVSVTVTGNTIGASGEGNVATGVGGGARLWAADDLTLSDNAFSNNAAPYGGALYFDVDLSADHDGSVELNGNAFLYNTAVTSSGAVALNSTYCNCDVSFVGNLFYRNVVSAGTAGAMGLSVTEFGDSFLLLNNIFAENRSYDSGGALLLNSDAAGHLDLWNNTFADNTSSNGFGGALFVGLNHISAYLGLYNSIFWNNNALDDDKDDIYMGLTMWDEVDFSNAIVNAWHVYDGVGEQTYLNPTGAAFSGFSSSNLITTSNDPLFVGIGDALYEDYRLQEGSPALDVGGTGVTALTALDFALAARTQGVAPDLGAVEGYFDFSFDGGDGSSGAPYQISTCDQLQYMDSDLDASYVLVGNVDCLETLLWNYDATTDVYNGFDPVGSEGDPFVGHFDGQGYSISGLYLNYRGDDDHVGLFGVTEGALLEDFILTDSDETDGDEEDDFFVTGQDYVGAVVGWATDGTILTDVESFLNVRSFSDDPSSGEEHIGGMVGFLEDSFMKNSTANGAVVGDDSVGGMVGTLEDSTLMNVTSNADTSGDDEVGGLVGAADNDAFIYYSSVYGATVTGDNSIGGLLGDSDADGDNVHVVQCSSSNTVYGVDYVGGLIGDVSETLIQNSYSTGDVNYQAWVDPEGIEDGLESGSDFGGLVGWIADATVRNSYATGAVTGGVHPDDDTYIAQPLGALIGDVNDGVTIERSFATGLVSGSLEGEMGGFLGERSDDLLLVDNYFDASSTGFQDCYPDARLTDGQCTAVNTGLEGDLTDSTYFYDESLLPLSLWDSDVWTFYADEVPDLNERLSSSHLYEVGSCYLLQEMAEDLDGDYVLLDDVDCSATAGWNGGLGFVPVGDFSDGAFTGSLDGQNYQIAGLTMSRPANHQGLFGVAEGAAISDLYLYQTLISGGSYVGALAGSVALGTTLDGVVVTESTILGDDFVGGLVGLNQNSLVYDAHAYGLTVTGVDVVGGFFGALIGDSLNTNYLERSSVQDTDVTGYGTTGGLVGRLLEAGILDAYFTGTVTESHEVAGTDPGYVAGIAGEAEIFRLENVYTSATITPLTANYGAGLVGRVLQEGSMVNSFVSGVLSSASHMVYGTFESYADVNDLTLEGLYYDDSIGGTGLCFTGGTGSESGCTGVDVLGDAAYWTDLVHAPVSAWDITDVWDLTEADLPVLRSTDLLEETVYDALTYGEWRFDEGAEDTCFDYLDICNEEGYLDGEMNGPEWTADPSHLREGDNPYALRFVSTDNDQVDMEELMFPEQFTAAFWVYLDGTQDDANTILANGASNVISDGFRIFIHTAGTTDGRVIFEAGNGTNGDTASSIAGAIQEAVWAHVAVLVDSTTGEVSIYVNGEDVTEDDSFTYTEFNRSGSWTLGTMTDGMYRLSGDLDDLIIENTLYTAEAIAALAGIATEESSGGSGGVGFVGGGSRGGGGGGSRGSSRDTTDQEEVVNDDDKVLEEPLFVPVVFSDIEGHWAKDYIQNVQEWCEVNGYRDEAGSPLGLYGPDQAISRAELVKMLSGCFLPSGQTPAPATQIRFTDVSPEDWFVDYVAYAFDEGWVKGYEDGTFAPNQSIVRAEALKLLSLAFYSETEIDEGLSSLSVERVFSDVPSGEWYARYVNFAAMLRVVSGMKDEAGVSTGTFAPQALLTRGEAAKIIVQFFNSLPVNNVE